MENKKRDLIDRGQIQYTWWQLDDGTFTDGVTLQSVIRSMPTVDAVEVVHGRWIERKEIFYESEGEVDAIGCSVCGKSQRKLRRTNYCPDCGAKMDGGSNE